MAMNDQTAAEIFGKISESEAGNEKSSGFIDLSVYELRLGLAIAFLDGLGIHHGVTMTEVDYYTDCDSMRRCKLRLESARTTLKAKYNAWRMDEAGKIVQHILNAFQAFNTSSK